MDRRSRVVRAEAMEAEQAKVHTQELAASPAVPLGMDELGAIARGDINPGRQWGLSLAGDAANTDDMRQNLPILYALALAGPRVLEIGTNDGTSALAFLMGARDNRTNGHVTSIDIADVPVARTVIERAGLSSLWTFMKGSSHDLLPQLRAQGRRFDTILVDGDHSYEGAKQDVVEVEAMLEPHGVLITHDSYMVTSDYDASFPHGQKCRRGCGLLAREMLHDPKWVGIIFGFNCNLALWRRRADVEAGFVHVIGEATAQGCLPGRS